VHDGPFTSLAVLVPTSALSLREQVLSSLIAVPMPASDPVTAMVHGIARSVDRGLPHLPAPAQRTAIRTLLDTIEMLCVHHATRIGAWHGVSRAGRLDAILSYLDDHLADPELAPPMVAAAHYMSVRTLHSLAQESGISIAGWIRRRRLERCRADLADPELAGLGVSAIGARWGLPSASHFCTLFREEFGTTPSAYRRALAEPQRALG